MVVGAALVVVVLDVGGVVVVGEVVGGVPDVVVVPLVGGCPGWPGTPRQAPNWLWQPGPQYSMEEPHQKNCEQQGPKLGLPMQIVLLPHLPSVVTSRSPVGEGMVDVVVVLVEGVPGVVVELVVGVLLVLVLLVVGVGRGLGHPQTP